MHEKITEEVLTVQCISAYGCPDGRHYQELVCTDVNNEDIIIIIPTTPPCDQDVCPSCNKEEKCSLSFPYEIELDRKLIIYRKPKCNLVKTDGK